MIFYLIMIAVGVLAAYTLLYWFSKADPKEIVRLLKWAVVVLLLLVMIGLAVTGKAVLAFAGFPVLLVWFQRYRTIMQGLRAFKRFMNGKAQGAAGKTDPNAPMTRQEALDILGLEPDACEAEIKAAYYRKIKEVHPDLGGSDELAARINRAKEVLLKGQ
ncbi:DnaJ domain-containing protein [Terasakiella pusilla]|jgi:hypothetical protein|uniref:DnaJ domain-containing protein n=1 Tax=Terasakiella pusilla TaxID=64973 RepID=UPI00068AA25C|nr:J domain-containing protein [Terasakiella pusilla]